MLSHPVPVDQARCAAAEVAGGHSDATVGRCWAAIGCLGPVSVLDSGCKLLDGEEADGGCYGMICEMLRQEGNC